MSGIAYTGWARPLLAGRPLRTPAFYYSVDVMAADLRALQEALGTRLVMQLSACPLPDVLSRLPEDVRFGVVTASRAEMNMVIAWATEHAYLHAPALDPQLARAVLGAGHRVIVETPRQIALLAELRGRREVKPVLLGLNMAAVGNEDGTGRGLDRDGALAAVDAAREHGIAVGGVALLRREAFDADRACASLPAVAALATELEARAGAPMSTLLLGEWTGSLDDKSGLARYREALATLPPHLQPLHETGDTAFARAGVFVTRVVDTVRVGTMHRAICDASLASAFLLSDAAGSQRRGGPPAVLEPSAAAGVTTVLDGGSGLPGDRYGAISGTVAEGDLVVIPDAGAWCRTYAPSALKGLGGAPSFLLGAAVEEVADA